MHASGRVLLRADRAGRVRRRYSVPRTLGYPDSWSVQRYNCTWIVPPARPWAHPARRACELTAPARCAAYTAGLVRSATRRSTLLRVWRQPRVVRQPELSGRDKRRRSRVRRVRLYRSITAALPSCNVQARVDLARAARNSLRICLLRLPLPLQSLPTVGADTLSGCIVACAVQPLNVSLGQPLRMRAGPPARPGAAAVGRRL